MAKGIKNIGASVRARLLNLSNANGQSFDLVLTRFALGRPAPTMLLRRKKRRGR